ncbi:tetratricopeptide repeat protein [Flagellimonas sediminis]|uniref:Uncharacterized protein n=1 Tax=Flagellimonas sediminis TaxID=2696468 RepID=A0A6I5KS24_9FLAO|nr:tetratricopeptide repeat protein [Allomuricauda sediminis]NDV42755.1 hypothetical protein [Allomuricauda sediminis]
MGKYFKAILVFFTWMGCVNAQNTISGRITDGTSKLSNVHVVNLTSGSKTSSDQEGWYQILARPKDELQYTYIGMDTVSILVEDVTKILNIKMSLRVEQLDEVVVEQKISKQKRLAMTYIMDSSVVNTSFGCISPATVAYHLKVIDGSEFTPGSDILNAIASRRSGIRVGTIGDPSTGGSRRTLFIRGMGSLSFRTPALFEIDGNIFSDAPTWLDVSMVLRVGIIPGIQAVWRYGHIASGGVVVINTKNGVHGLREENGSKPYDQARLRNNFVTGKVVSSEDAKNEVPSYLQAIQNTTSLTQAVNTVNEYERLYFNVPYFYLDCYTLIFDKFGEDVADQFMEGNLDQIKDNAVWLKALAYIYESQRRFDKAHTVYKEVYALRPEYAQSYIDMANSYRNLGLKESATSLYARHSYLLDEGLLTKDSLELSEIIQREMDNLFALESRSEQIRERNVDGIGPYTTRLVFEWNDSEAEFDLQFVNPHNQYFNWKHTNEDMPERIRSEKEQGYSMADFLLDDALPGTWKVNVTYNGNKQLTPSYLKATIYRNYGSRLQTKDIKVFRMGLKGANQYLFDLDLPSSVVQK